MSIMSKGLDGASLIALELLWSSFAFPRSFILVLLGASFDRIFLRKDSNLELGRSDRVANGRTG